MRWKRNCHNTSQLVKSRRNSRRNFESARCKKYEATDVAGLNSPAALWKRASAYRNLFNRIRRLDLSLRETRLGQIFSARVHSGQISDS